MIDIPLCTCHNLPTLWTSYNREICPSAPADHISCQVTGEHCQGKPLQRELPIAELEPED